jgi:hypothetical integral membrane protein (TIGR02206 family)
MDDPAPSFHAFGVAHIAIIVLTTSLPFALAAMVRRTNSGTAERIVAFSLGGLLLLNFIVYEIYMRRQSAVSWWQTLPLQLCDWAMFVIIVAMWTGRRRWFEVAYFWGLGGTLQAIITPNLKYGFPDLRFVSFFVAHSVIIIGIIFLMLAHKYRPWPGSIVRTFICTEGYFVIVFTVDLLTGVNYGFLLHKPEAFSLLSLLSDWRPLYLLQMHGVALLVYIILYIPFAVWDIARSGATRELPAEAHR